MSDSRAEEQLRKALDEDDHDEAWATDLPEADELPDAEDATQAVIISTRAPRP